MSNITFTLEYLDIQNALTICKGYRIKKSEGEYFMEFPI